MREMRLRCSRFKGLTLRIRIIWRLILNRQILISISSKLITSRHKTRCSTQSCKRRTPDTKPLPFYSSSSSVLLTKKPTSTQSNSSSWLLPNTSCDWMIILWWTCPTPSCQQWKYSKTISSRSTLSLWKITSSSRMATLISSYSPSRSFRRLISLKGLTWARGQGPLNKEIHSLCKW